MMSSLATSFPAMMMEYVLIFCMFFVITKSATPCYTSIFAFGDSVTDNGNLVNIKAPKTIHQGCFPNGETYFHRPTGRCCDGRLIVDFLAQYFGLPISPPFTGLKNADIHTGVNFAVAGARVLDTSYYEEIGVFSSPVTNASLRVQMSWFKDLLPSLCGTEPGNDYRWTVFERALSVEEILSLTHKVTTTISLTVTELIELGVGTVMVPGLTPEGCLAFSLTYFGTPNKETGCVLWVNNMVEYHNNLLKEHLNVLRIRYPDANIIYADYYNSTMQLYTSPEKYGFMRTFAACCGAGGPYNYNKSVQCGDPGTTACSDPSVFMNWDGPHLTEAAYKWITDALLKGPYTYPHIPTSCILETPTSKHSFSHQAL